MKNLDAFQQFCKSEGYAVPEKEYRFHDTRKWRFDYAFPNHKIAIEVEGGVWIRGRHNRGKGFLNDMDKYNTSTMMGWRILRAVPDMLLTVATIDMIKYCINYRNSVKCISTNCDNIIDTNYCEKCRKLWES